VYLLSRVCGSVLLASLSRCAGVFVVLFAARCFGPENVQESLWPLRTQYEQGSAPSHLTLRDLHRSHAADVRSIRRRFSGRAPSISEVSDEAKETDGERAEGRSASEDDLWNLQVKGDRAQIESGSVAGNGLIMPMPIGYDQVRRIYFHPSNNDLMKT